MTTANSFPARPWGNPQEVADFYGLHVQTVWRLLRQGLMKGYQPSGARGHWRIHIDDAEDWVRGGAPTRRGRRIRKGVR